MNGRWFYRMMNEEFGPIVEDQLVELIRSQILSDSDEVRVDGSESWQTLYEVECFQSAFYETESDGMAVAQTFDDLSFEFEESPSNIRKQGRVDVRREERGTVSVDVRRDRRIQPVEPSEPDRPEFEVDPMEPGKVAESVLAVVGKSSPEMIPTNGADSAPKDAKKRRRRKAILHDPLMEEIARELAERANSADAPKASPTSAPMPSAPAPMSRPALSSMPSAPAAFSGVDSRPAPRHVAPVPRPNVPKRPSFQMPEGKTLGTFGGAIVAVLAVISFSLGWISLPFGSTGGALPGNAGVVTTSFLQYQLLATVPDPEEWKAFQESVQTNVKPIADAGEDSSDKVTQVAKQLVLMATLQPSEDPEPLHKIGKELQPLVNEIVGVQ